MSTSLHAVSDVGFGNVYFVLVIFDSCGRKMRFSESSQKPISEKSIFGQFDVVFLNVWFFSQGGSGIFLLVPSSKSVLTRTWAL